MYMSVFSDHLRWALCKDPSTPLPPPRGHNSQVENFCFNTRVFGENTLRFKLQDTQHLELAVIWFPFIYSLYVWGGPEFNTKQRAFTVYNGHHCQLDLRANSVLCKSEIGGYFTAVFSWNQEVGLSSATMRGRWGGVVARWGHWRSLGWCWIVASTSLWRLWKQEKSKRW